MTKKIPTYSTLLLGSIIVVGLLLRLWGVYPGYSQTHPDEPQVYSRALLIVLGKQNELGYYGYPALVPLIHAVVYATTFIPLGILEALIVNPDRVVLLSKDFELFLMKFVVGPNEINVLYWGRIVSACIGGLSVLFTYLVAKKYFNLQTGFLAALFVAVNYRHVFSSHYALVDVPNGLFFLITYLFAVDMLRKPKLRGYVYSAIAAGLSLSVKLSPFMLIPPALAHILSGVKINTKNFWVKPLIFGVVFMLIVLVVNLFHLSHLEELFEDWETLNKRYVSGINEFLPYPYFYLYKQGLQPVMSILFILGVGWGLLKKTKESIILLVPVVLFFFILTFYSIGGVYIRNFVAVIPIILIFSALGITYLWKYLDNKICRAFIVVILTFATLGHVFDSITVSKAYSQEWNMEKIKSELANGYEGKTIAAHQWIGSKVLPDTTKHAIRRNSTLHSIRALQNENIDYALIDTESTEDKMTWWMAFRGNSAYASPPKDLLYSTFSGGGIKETLNYKVSEVVKSPLAPEMNFYLVKVPGKITNFEGDVFYKETFDEQINWRTKGSLSREIPFMGQIENKDCKGNGCVRIGNVQSSDTNWDYLASNGSPRFFRHTSAPVKVKPGFSYRASIEVFSKTEIPNDKSEGFMKIELYPNIESASSDKPGKHIYLTEKYWGKSRKTLDTFFFVPEGLEYMTISLQTDYNPQTDIYFDNLLVETSELDYDIPEDQKDLPEDVFFVTSL